MDKKKLIGTIIGVILFGALIAGATYAWLTYAITLNKDVFNFSSTNFSIGYTKNGNIGDVPIISGLPTTADFSSKGKVKITAVRTGTVDGQMKIYLYSAEDEMTNLLIQKQALKYAITIGSDDVTSSNYTGVVNNIAMLLNDSDIAINGTAKDIYVYVWLDVTKVDEDLVSKTYSGYIGARAEQIH